MRTAIISDIHSNIEALDEVLRVLEYLKIDRYVCLGDLVGYGASPNEVMDRLRSLVDFTIMGNHDAAVAGQMEYRYYYDEARQVLSWTQEVLTPENMAYLNAMPYFRLDNNVCYVHGEPMGPENFNYLYTLEQAQALIPNYDMLQPLTLVGHSHLRRVFEISPNGAIELEDENLTLNPDKKYAVAVGSVGQPRDYDPRAAFLIYDSDAGRVEFYRVEYDIDSAANKIIQEGLPEYFANRLFSGS